MTPVQLSLFTKKTAKENVKTKIYSGVHESTKRIYCRYSGKGRQLATKVQEIPDLFITLNSPSSIRTASVNMILFLQTCALAYCNIYCIQTEASFLASYRATVSDSWLNLFFLFICKLAFKEVQHRLPLQKDTNRNQLQDLHIKYRRQPKQKKNGGGEEERKRGKEGTTAICSFFHLLLICDKAGEHYPLLKPAGFRF